MDSDQQRILGFFLEEAQEHLQTLEQGLTDLTETCRHPDVLQELFRAAHSVKGGAAMLGLKAIQQQAHRLEDRMRQLQESPHPTPREAEELIAGVDSLGQLLEQVQQPPLVTPAPLPPPAIAPLPLPTVPQQDPGARLLAEQLLEDPSRTAHWLLENLGRDQSLVLARELVGLLRAALPQWDAGERVSV